MAAVPIPSRVAAALEGARVVDWSDRAASEMPGGGGAIARRDLLLTADEVGSFLGQCAKALAADGRVAFRCLIVSPSVAHAFGKASLPSRFASAALALGAAPPGERSTLLAICASLARRGKAPLSKAQLSGAVREAGFDLVADYPGAGALGDWVVARRRPASRLVVL